MQNGTCGRPVACLQEGDRLPDCLLSQAGRGSAHGLPAVAGVGGGVGGVLQGVQTFFRLFSNRLNSQGPL